MVHHHSRCRGARRVLRRCSGSGVTVTMLGAGSNTLISDDGDRWTRDPPQRSPAPSRRCGHRRARRGLHDAARGTGLRVARASRGSSSASACRAPAARACTAMPARSGPRWRTCSSIARRWIGPASPMTLAADACDFSYRHSRFKDDLRGNVIVSARLRVHADDPAAVRERTDAIQAERKASQPYGIRSLGSVFKNPPDDKAGRLIEAAGLKGRRSAARRSPRSTPISSSTSIMRDRRGRAASRRHRARHGAGAVRGRSRAGDRRPR